MHYLALIQHFLNKEISIAVHSLSLLLEASQRQGGLCSEIQPKTSVLFQKDAIANDANSSCEEETCYMESNTTAEY